MTSIATRWRRAPRLRAFGFGGGVNRARLSTRRPTVRFTLAPGIVLRTLASAVDTVSVFPFGVVKVIESGVAAVTSDPILVLAFPLTMMISLARRLAGAPL